MFEFGKRAKGLALIALSLAAAAGLAAPALTAEGREAAADPISGRPDLTGKWMMSRRIVSLRTSDGSAPPLSSRGRAEYQRRQALMRSDPKTDPVSECLMHGVPRLLYAFEPFLLLQTKRNVVFAHQVNHTFRVAYWNDPKPEDWSPNWLGHSSAAWDGGTLVIDTDGMNTQTWLDYSGLPHGEKLSVQERYRLKNHDLIEGEIVIKDPDFYTRAWRSSFRLVRQPGMELVESVCVENHRM
jgi:hypothetical protein